MAQHIGSKQREYVRNIVDMAVTATDDVINSAVELNKTVIPDSHLRTIITLSLEDLRSARSCLMHVIRKKICDHPDTTQAPLYTKSVVMALLLDLLPFTSEELIMERRHMAATRVALESQPLSTPTDPINEAENSSSTTSDASKKPTTGGHISPRAIAEMEAEKLGWLFYESSGEEMLQRMIKGIPPKDLGTDGSVPITHIVDRGLSDSTLIPYLDLIREKTQDTVVGSIKQTVAACRETMEEILANRAIELKDALDAREKNEKQEEDAQCVAHTMAWGNLVAARAAMDVLREKYLTVVSTKLGHYSVIEAPELVPVPPT